MSEEIETIYKCVYCDKSYTREPWFKKHSCKKKKDFDKLTGLESITAMKLYDLWRKRKGFFKKTSDIDTFRKSPYADIFINLVEFTNNNWIASNRFKYLNWLIDCNVPTKYWCTDRQAQNFRDYIATHDDYMTQVKASLAYIQKWSADHDKDWHNFFSEVGLGDAFYMMITYKLSPWLVLGYDKAVITLLERFNDETILEIDEHIQLYHWLDTINENEERRARINQYCKEVFE